MKFEEFDLDLSLLQAIDEMGFTHCTPVQEKTLKFSLIGTDVAVQSQTGTGKTAAFLISIFQLFIEQPELDGKTALVIAPTRELADQIEKDAINLGKYTDISITSFYGGVGYHKQEKYLSEGVRLAIGTPGRLIDFFQQGKLDLSKIGVLVIDEADRMFDMGFIPDLRRLIVNMPSRENRITMLYSATLSTRVKSLAWQYMKKPEEISIAPERITVEGISQELYHVSRQLKLSLLLGIIENEKPNNALIFTNTKQVAYEVAVRLEKNGLSCEYIIGDLAQGRRQHAINQLKNGKLSYLVATDVAARGLHIEDLSLVVNYDLPEYSEYYVHRIGRTGRAGRSGKAVSLACEEYVYALEGIENFIQVKIPTVSVVENMLVEDLSAKLRIGHYSDNKHRKTSSENKRRRKEPISKNLNSSKLSKKQEKTYIGEKSHNLSSKKRKSNRINRNTEKILEQKSLPSKSTFNSRNKLQTNQRQGANTAIGTKVSKVVNYRNSKVKMKHSVSETSQSGKVSEERLLYYKQKYGEEFRFIEDIPTTKNVKKKSLFKFFKKVFGKT